MRILALEPYYGGSHQSFLENWISRSRHDWTVLHLPAYKWKWRMRHAPLTFAEQLSDLPDLTCDCAIASDMLDVAAWRGLTPDRFTRLPLLLYFHENQLTYPMRTSDERDLHFGHTNITSAVTADAVWFNSKFHCDSFLAAARQFAARMPDYQPIDAVERILAKSEVHPPGIPSITAAPRAAQPPLHILWAARWEHDKNPQMFFDAVRRMKQRGTDFRLSVIGEQFDDSPDCFSAARHEFADNIVRWGYQQSRSEYEQTLAEADLFVSTADHEFFGIAAGEAILAGCRPLLPNRLAYPDLLPSLDAATRAAVFYDGTVDGLTNRLLDILSEAPNGSGWRAVVERCRADVLPLEWDRLAPQYDSLLNGIAALRVEA